MADGFRPLVAGSVESAAVVLDEPLSFWGGLDPETGRVIDVHHPQRGTVVSGKILLMPSARGSSSSASTLLEAVRLKTAPLAVILTEEDNILVLGSIVARALYGRNVPVGILARSLYERVRSGDSVKVEPSSVSVSRNGTSIIPPRL